MSQRDHLGPFKSWILGRRRTDNNDQANRIRKPILGDHRGTRTIPTIGHHPALETIALLARVAVTFFNFTCTLT